MQILSDPISALNLRESPKFSRNTMVTSDFRPEVEIQPFRACAMHPAIIGTVRSLWTWLCCRYHIPQNVFLVIINIIVHHISCVVISLCLVAVCQPQLKS